MAFELRMYDGRVGRWMTTDPYSQYYSPYLAMGNNPISRIDPDGGKTYDWYQNEETGNYEWWEGSEEKSGYKHLGESYTINVKNTEGEITRMILLNNDGSASHIKGEVVTKYQNTTTDFNFISGRLVRTGNWGLSETLLLGQYSLYGFGSSALTATPFPKAWLKQTPQWFHGGYGRGWHKGTPYTSVGSFGRGLPNNLAKTGGYILGAEAIHDAVRITTDADVLKKFSNNLNNNPYRGFYLGGFNLLRIDNKQIQLNKERVQNHQQKNPYRGFVIF